MPVLGIIETEQLVLPSTKDLPAEQQAWVKVNRNITLDDVAGANNYESHSDQLAYSIATVVKEWNYTDEGGQPTPVTLENCKKLIYIDTAFINEWIQSRINASKEGVSDAEKKA